MNNKELNDRIHRTTFYDSMYEYCKDADISHYRLSVGQCDDDSVTSEFEPIDDPDVHLQIDDPIEHKGKTYIPICWGEEEESAILETAIDEECWVRYIPGNREGTYVSDGIVYPTETAAMRGR